jgi:hypothetical protein
MRTEVLEEILHADSQLSNSEDSDMDTILYIMEVIAKREKEQPTGKFTDVHTAWSSFSEYYLPYLENDKSLYDDEEIKGKTDIKQIPLYKSSPSRKRRLQLRIACITIFVVVSLFTGTVTAKAFGFNLWSAVAEWTMDIFGFSQTDIQDTNNISEYDSMNEALNHYGIEKELAPTWFPKGYLFKSVIITETPKRTTFDATYKNQDAEILVTIISSIEPATSIYEKDDSDVVVYTVNEIKYYIMTNIKQTKVVWLTDNYECSITGVFSFDEAKIMIDSINSIK